MLSFQRAKNDIIWFIESLWLCFAMIAGFSIYIFFSWVAFYMIFHSSRYALFPGNYFDPYGLKIPLSGILIYLVAHQFMHFTYIKIINKKESFSFETEF